MIYDTDKFWVTDILMTTTISIQQELYFIEKNINLATLDINENFVLGIHVWMKPHIE